MWAQKVRQTQYLNMYESISAKKIPSIEVKPEKCSHFFIVLFIFFRQIKGWEKMRQKIRLFDKHNEMVLIPR